MGIFTGAGSGHLSLGHIELVLPQLPVGQGDDDARCPVTCRSEQSHVMNAALATGVAALRLHKVTGSLTVSGGVVDLLTGLGEGGGEFQRHQWLSNPNEPHL